MPSQKQLSRNEIRTVVIQCLTNLLSAKGKLSTEPLQESTNLIGPQSVLDSLELVTLIVDVEQNLQMDSIVLADENAMIQKNSPFKSVQSLIEHILSLQRQ